LSSRRNIGVINNQNAVVPHYNALVESFTIYNEIVTELYENRYQSQSEVNILFVTKNVARLITYYA
jgi:hypothetical protein